MNNSKCRCGGDHSPPWKCPQSKCGICKVKGDHWARYCPDAVTARMQETVAPGEDAGAHQDLRHTPLETETPAKTQPAKTETQPIKIESQALPSGPYHWGQEPVQAPEYRRWKKTELDRECQRVGLKSGPVNTMVERLTTLWTRQTETPQTDETPPKKTKVGRPPKLPFLNIN